MCKRNSPDEKKEPNMGCLGETPHMKTKSKWDVKEKLPTLKKEDNMGCVRETPEIKTKLAWDV